MLSVLIMKSLGCFYEGFRKKARRKGYFDYICGKVALHEYESKRQYDRAEISSIETSDRFLEFLISGLWVSLIKINSYWGAFRWLSFSNKLLENVAEMCVCLNRLCVFYCLSCLSLVVNTCWIIMNIHVLIQNKSSV